MIVSNGQQESREPRVLMLSHRNIYEQEVWRCAFREFEHLIQELDTVDFIAPGSRGWYGNGKRIALRLGEHFSTPFNPGVTPVKLERDYDLFFVVCEKPSELLHITAVDGWKERCKTSICWLPEFWIKEIPSFNSALEVLRRFDHVFFVHSSIEPFQKIIGGRGEYLPAGIDAFKFCPYPNPPTRCIDVLSIGRRSEQTHNVLLRMAREEGLFYVYDTINDLHGYDLEQHRFLYASMTKRSRYFIANPGKIDSIGETGGQVEFGYRQFEGAAAGTIMIGQRPNNKAFDRIFNWDGSVIDLPFGSDNIDAVIRQLDKEPERQKRIRHTNITQALLHHDWVYRWETVLSKAGIQPLPMVFNRKQALKNLADEIEGAYSSDSQVR